MQMDRNTNDNGLGKYALINLRKLTAGAASGPDGRLAPEIEAALKTLEAAGGLEWGRTGEPDEFFVLKLKDRNAQSALTAYACSILADDPEFASEVATMADRSGPSHPRCKSPD